MGTISKLTAAAAAMTMLVSPMSASAEADLKTAENIRKLDIMLMVTSLRCRTGKDDFQAEYRKFSAAHLSTLNLASRQMRTSLQAKHGNKGAMRQLDRLSVGMANEYGQGHPWLECGELKKVAQGLAKERDPTRLADAAGELLGKRRSTNLAFAGL